MNTSLKKLLFLLFSLTPMFVNAQSVTDIELHNRYWTYRENFRKYFTSLGTDNGEGLPFNKIRVSLGGRAMSVDANGADEPNKDGPFVRGLLETGGDVTAFMAEYIGVLASEYWLLKKNGMGASDEMKAVKNELYFAINAIDRLDKYSKKYYEQTTQPDNNDDGFFVRDDTG